MVAAIPDCQLMIINDTNDSEIIRVDMVKNQFQGFGIHDIRR